MTDRKLLELAAKAACIQIDRWHGDGGDYWTGRDADDKDRNPGLWIRWNPLRDDGDALRLEVALNLTTKHRFLDFLAEENTLCGGDYCKARRRAIVRAAAEIGKDLK